MDSGHESTGMGISSDPQGSVVISIDAELGWGFHDYADPPEERLTAARSGWRFVANALERHGIPATWAVVGHLFHESCARSHDAHPAPAGWFPCQRPEWADRQDLLCAQDLVADLVDSPLDHDIGCHTYSHVEFGETTESVAAAELDRWRSVASAFDLEPRSFVFPRNNVGHRSVLAENGVDVYRGPQPGRRMDALEKLVTTTVGTGRPPLVTPTIDEYGLVDVPGSLFCYSFEGTLRDVVTSVTDDPVAELARRGVDAAAREGGVFHLWLHPNNVADPAQCRRLDGILAYIADNRDSVRIETMSEVATRIRAEHDHTATV
jgi:peptidoglycan/xylan/chitin deacetylase (PgdA/CDA1 family)